MFGVKLRLAGDNQRTVRTRGLASKPRNRTRSRTRNRTSNRLRLGDDWRKSIGRLEWLIAHKHRETRGWHGSVLSMIWWGWGFRHLHLVEHDRGIGKGTRSYKALIWVVREVVALIVRVEIAREVLIEVGVGIALVEVLRETVATGVVLRERAVRRMALTIEALTVTMVCKWCVLMSGGRTRSVSESASTVVAATAVPWTVVRSAAIVVSLLIATIWGRLVRRSVSCRRVILRKLIVVVGIHVGSGHVVHGVVLEMLEWLNS